MFRGHRKKSDFEKNARMSAYGYKQTYSRQLANVRFTSESGHYRRKISALPESRHSVSALPPKADINGCGAGCPLMTRSGTQLMAYLLLPPRFLRVNCRTPGATPSKFRSTQAPAFRVIWPDCGPRYISRRCGFLVSHARHLRT